MIQWMNCNQGFVMGVLTLVYVMATIFIWCSNKKAASASSEQAKAAAMQLEEMKNTQQQNVKIQLFEKRYSIFNHLSDWFNIAEDVFYNSLSNPDEEAALRKKVFNDKIFGSNSFDAMQCTKEIRDIIRLLDDSEIAGQTGELTEEENNNLLINRKKWQDRLYYLRRQLTSYIDSLDLCDNESYKLERLEYLYKDIDYKKINIFVNAFYDMVINSTTENLIKLESTFSAIDRRETLQKMKSQLYVLEV